MRGYRREMDRTSRSVVVLDVDGTLVDTNYHHVIAWSRALAAFDIAVPLRRVHRAIGMGGDRLVGAVAGDEAERAHGDDLRERWKQEFDAIIDEVHPLPGAQELLAALKERDVRIALASSANPEHAQHAFDLLDAEQYTDTATTSEDAGSSKPDPELVEAAIERLGGLGDAGACVVGDSVWDVHAAQAAGLPAYAVLTGGVGRDELTEAGAVHVYDDLIDLREHLEDWLPR